MLLLRVCVARRELAAAGKCDSEPATMLGLGGRCRRTCEDCVDCADGDLICLRKNMRSRRASKQKQGA